MFDKLYTFGCSFTKDNYQSTWANIVAEEFDAVLDNRAERGCGSNYIIKRLLISRDIDPRNSLVAIMWPCADRYDLWADVTTPHLLGDYTTASWPDGKSPKLVDLRGQQRLDQGFILNGSVPRGYKHYYYKYFYTAYDTVHRWYTDVITAQLFLNKLNIRYIMMSTFPLIKPLQYHIDDYAVETEIFQEIDQTKFVLQSDTQGFYQWCRQQNVTWLDRHHPTTEAHKKYSQQFIIPKISSMFCQ